VRTGTRLRVATAMGVVASTATMVMVGAFAANVHGGGGRITPSGRIGLLQVGHSRVQAVTKFAGRPDRVSKNPYSETLGYSCHRSGAGFPISRKRVCRTAFFAETKTRKLYGLLTVSRHFAAPHGVKVGMKAREAARRLRKHISAGDCGNYIDLSGRHTLFVVGLTGGRVHELDMVHKGHAIC
jgi:hypothetical protein